jgi:hypothetical protein
MNVTFDALPWHDAQLLEILIDRRRPGECDEVPGLTSIRERWHRLGVPLDQLRCYRIETASTASVIQIYAKQFEIS